MLTWVLDFIPFQDPDLRGHAALEITFQPNAAQTT
jgi:hypothetical protein